MKKSIVIFLLSLAVMSTFCVGCRDKEQVVDEVVVCEEPTVFPGFYPDSLRCVEGEVKSGQFFSTLMMGLGQDPSSE